MCMLLFINFIIWRCVNKYGRMKNNILTALKEVLSLTQFFLLYMSDTEMAQQVTALAALHRTQTWPQASTLCLPTAYT